MPEVFLRPVDADGVSHRGRVFATLAATEGHRDIYVTDNRQRVFVHDRGARTVHPIRSLGHLRSFATDDAAFQEMVAALEAAFPDVVANVLHRPPIIDV